MTPPLNHSTCTWERKLIMFVLMNLLLTISSLVVPVLTFSKENANISTDCLNEKVQLKIVPRSIILNERDVLKFKCVMMTHNRSLPAREVSDVQDWYIFHNCCLFHFRLSGRKTMLYYMKKSRKFTQMVMCFGYPILTMKI